MTLEDKRKKRLNVVVKQVTPRQCGGIWVSGMVEHDYRFSALVFEGHADNPAWELEDSRITKLWIQRIEDRKCVYNWDRGLDCEAVDASVKAVMRQVLYELAAYPKQQTAASATEEPFVVAPTQGPYGYYRDADGVDDLWVIAPAEDTAARIATIVFWDDDTGWAAKAEANARLLAAAPELLKALHELLAVGQRGDADDYNAAAGKALAAIAKIAG